ncbi:MAG: hypothetical protein ACK5NT_01460 [Pyrinomonadaceae bacterium]
MILIYGSKTDVSARKVSDELAKRNVSYALVDTKDVLNQEKTTQLNHSLGSNGANPTFWIKNENQTVDLTEVSVIYVRNPSDVIIENRNTDARLNGWVDREFKNYVWETLELLQCQWFPAKPSSIYTMENEKLKELYVAQEVGLSVPDTIVTNEPQRAIKFFQKHDGRIISKRYSRPRIPFENTEFAAPTQPVSLRDIGFVKHVQYAPTLFQEYVPKLKELRVTVVGNICVAAEIDSQQTHRTKHDWRTYDKKRTPHRVHNLPKDIQIKLIKLTKNRGLCYGTCDLVISPTGEYVFLEINPAGQYVWIENLINVDITKLICDELIRLSDFQSGNQLP